MRLIFQTQMKAMPPKTGDSYPITVLAVIAAALFVIVVSSRKRTGKTY